MKWFVMLFFLTSIIKLAVDANLNLSPNFFAAALVDKAAPGKGKMRNAESEGKATTSMQQKEKQINAEHKITKESNRKYVPMEWPKSDLELFTLSKEGLLFVYLLLLFHFLQKLYSIY